MQQKSVIFKIGESKPTPDKNKNNYKTCKFRGQEQEYAEIPGMGKVVVSNKPKDVSLNLYEKSYLPGNPMDFGYDLEVGSAIFGKIETRDVQPYSIKRADGTEHTATTSTVPVFGDSTSPSWETQVRAAFKNRGHIVVDKAYGVQQTPAEIPALPVGNFQGAQ